jgi:hypothetical protein
MPTVPIPPNSGDTFAFLKKTEETPSSNPHAWAATWRLACIMQIGKLMTPGCRVIDFFGAERVGKYLPHLQLTRYRPLITVADFFEDNAEVRIEDLAVGFEVGLLMDVYHLSAQEIARLVEATGVSRIYMSVLDIGLAQAGVNAAQAWRRKENGETSGAGTPTNVMRPSMRGATKKSMAKTAKKPIKLQRRSARSKRCATLICKEDRRRLNIHVANAVFCLISLM